MFDFYVILRVNWLHAYFASTDYKTWVVKFKFPNEQELELKGGNQSLKVKLFNV